mgnify:CR=1 FL=1
MVFDNDKTPRFRSFDGISEFQKLIFSGVNINFPSEEKDFDEVQILAPMRKGAVGTEALNQEIQNTLWGNEKPLFQEGLLWGRRIHDLP